MSSLVRFAVSTRRNHSTPTVSPKLKRTCSLIFGGELFSLFLQLSSLKKSARAIANLEGHLDAKDLKIGILKQRLVDVEGKLCHCHCLSDSSEERSELEYVEEEDNDSDRSRDFDG